MPADDHETLRSGLLVAAAEDWNLALHALWEAITVLPNLGGADRIELVRRTLLELLGDGRIVFATAPWPEGPTANAEALSTSAVERALMATDWTTSDSNAREHLWWTAARD